jgi:hypothetical protein
MPPNVSSASRQRMVHSIPNAGVDKLLSQSWRRIPEITPADGPTRLFLPATK